MLLALVLAIGPALSVVAVAGWHGAEVVYRYGIGVKSLPKVEQEESGHRYNGEAHSDHMEDESQVHTH